MKKSIFTRLIGSFILFGILTVITFAICILLQAFILLGDGVNSLYPDEMIDENGNISDFSAVQKAGGWIEELDENLNVVNVYGEKLTEDKSYNIPSLSDIISVNGKGKYIGFFANRENIGKYFLIIYSREVMQINTNFIVNKVSEYNSLNIMWLFFLLLIIEIALISLHLRRKIKKPLDRITEGMRSLKAGDGGARIDIAAEAEFKEIVDTFNSMAEELEAARIEKESLIVKKNQLLLELSHDIRTPVATIKSYANALEAGLVPEDRKQDYYRTIEVKADRVSALSDDMFMMLKMDNPDYVIAKSRTDICEYLRQLCAEYYDEIINAGFDFEIDIPDKEMTAEIDKALLSRVIGNLLTNARKYNKSGKLISLSCKRIDGSVAIAVRDDGEKIPTELSENMFSAFVRGDKTRKSDGGTGLGLSISKIIVDKHGGSLTYKRESGLNIFEVLIPAVNT